MDGRIKGRYQYLGWGNRYRFNDKLTLESNFTTSTNLSDVGFADIQTNGIDKIIFSRRDHTIAENTFNVKYNFNKYMGITTGVRHYWSKVEPQQYYYLRNTGRLVAEPAYDKNNNISFNFFNVDMVYFWQFAPGSFVNIVWKNAIDKAGDNVQQQYFSNLWQTLNNFQSNSLSLKVIYFIEYIDIKKHFRRKEMVSQNAETGSINPLFLRYAKPQFERRGQRHEWSR